LRYTVYRRERLGLISLAEVYNTPDGEPAVTAGEPVKVQIGGWTVLRCPECSAEIDVDEDEVEEGEILSCPECETELEVSQTHPVALNPIADELEEDDDEDIDAEEEDEEDFDEDGDQPDEADDDEEDDEDE
jgi:alpha-aminoadipate carrier protein LysW